ncbi:MAG: TolC family protein [Calditrichaeota bacterium]|nr:MAG: TolC family protein [Calditrichota bacterium]
MFLIILILLIPLNLFGQEISQNSTLQELLEFSAENNPSLKAKFHSWKASLERVPQVGSLPDPTLSFSYFVKEVETKVGPQKAKLSLSQKFPFFGKLDLAEKVVLKEAESLKQELDWEKVKLFFEVKKAYFELYFSQIQIKISQENLLLLEDILTVTKSKYENNKTSFANLIQTEIQIEKLKDRIKTLNQLLKVRQANLNFLLNRSSNAILPEVKLVFENLTLNKELLKTEILQNPNIKSLEFLVEKEKAKTKLSEKDFYPNFTFGIDYAFTESGTTQLKDDGKDPLMLMFGISVPIWREKYSAKVRESKFRQNSVEQKKQNQLNKFEFETESLFFEIEDSERKITLYENTLIPKEKQNLEVTKTAYQNGKLDFLNLIDAQKTLLEFELNLEMAKTKKAISLAKLKMITN